MFIPNFKLEDLTETLSMLTGLKFHVIEDAGIIMTQPAAHLILTAWFKDDRVMVRFESLEQGVLPQECKVSFLGFGSSKDPVDAYQKASLKALKALSSMPRSHRVHLERDGRDRGPDCSIYQRRVYQKQRPDWCDASSSFFHNIDGEYR